MSRRAAVSLMCAVGVIVAVGVVSRGAAIGAGAWPQEAGAPRDQAAPSGGEGAATYWITEFRRRWKAERRDSRARAATVRALRRSLRAVPYPHRLEQQFMCIHSFEGRWDDAGAPYFGGLQMDRDFQLAYGRPYVEAFGWADRWPVSVQIAVAIRAYLDRGFAPWPNTRRMCGL